MSSAAIQAKIKAGLARAGRRTGTGELKAVIIREQEPDLNTAPPTPGEPTAFPFTAMQSKFSFMEMQSGNVESGDVKFLLEAGQIEPQNDDKIKVAGILYEIEGIERVAPGGVPLMWKIHARGGVPDSESYAPGTPDPT